MWGGVALALVGIGYWALRQAGSANGIPWPLLILINAGLAALIGYEADKRGRSWALYAGFALVGTPILALILRAL